MPALALEIELKPAFRAGLCRHFFQCSPGQGAQHKAAVGRRRAAGDVDFALRVGQGLVGERRQQDGMRQTTAEQLQPGMALPQLAQQARPDPGALEGRAIRRQRRFVTATAGNVRQPIRRQEMLGQVLVILRAANLGGNGGQRRSVFFHAVTTGEPGGFARFLQ